MYNYRTYSYSREPHLQEIADTCSIASFAVLLALILSLPYFFLSYSRSSTLFILVDGLLQLQANMGSRPELVGHLASEDLQALEVSFGNLHLPGMTSIESTAVPPGMSPSTGPPGMAQPPPSLPPRPAGIPSNFQPPAGMANINFNAPVIRLGARDERGPATGDRMRDGGGARRGLGMGGGMDRERAERQQALAPPTREEIARTIFVGNITEGVGGDMGMERILRSAGNLRRWTRATEPDGKPCTFGFAEYEDAESLETAAEIFKDGVEVPVKRPEANGVKKENGIKTENGLNTKVEGDANVKTEDISEAKAEGSDDIEAGYVKVDKTENGDVQAEEEVTKARLLVRYMNSLKRFLLTRSIDRGRRRVEEIRRRVEGSPSGESGCSTISYGRRS